MMRFASKQRQSSRTSAWLRGKAHLGAAVAIAATGVGAVAAAIPAQAAMPASAASVTRWQLAYSTHGGPSQQFSYITAPAKNDAWAVATANPQMSPGPFRFVHWDGKTWSSVSIKAAAGFDFGYVYLQGFLPGYSSAPGNVWFFGNHTTTNAPEALVYNGKKWQAKSLPSDFQIPLAVVGPKDVWAQSAKTCDAYTAGCTVLLHWNGATWSRDKIPGIQPVASSAGAHAWIMTIADGDYVPVSGVAPTGNPIIYRTTGAKLANVATPRQAVIVQDQAGIVAAPDGRAWFTGDYGQGFGLYSWTGHKWTGSAIPEAVCSPGVPKPCTFYGNSTYLSYDGKNGFWDGPSGHWTGSKWINTSPAAKQLANAAFGNTVAIPGTGSAWSIGWVPRTAKSTATNSIVAVYGPLP